MSTWQGGWVGGYDREICGSAGIDVVVINPLCGSSDRTRTLIGRFFGCLWISAVSSLLHAPIIFLRKF